MSFEIVQPPLGGHTGFKLEFLTCATLSGIGFMTVRLKFEVRARLSQGLHQLCNPGGCGVYNCELLKFEVVA